MIDMTSPISMDYDALNQARVTLGIMGFSPSANPQDDGMVTARDMPKEGEEEGKPPKRAVRRRRRVRDTRFLPITRPMRRAQKKNCATQRCSYSHP